MTTPRVTEIPLALAAVEPDPFMEGSGRASVAQARLGEHQARERQAEMLRRAMRLRDGRDVAGKR